MTQLTEAYFGPVDVIELYREEGLSFPEGDSRAGQPFAEVIPENEEFTLILLGKGYSENDVHFLRGLVAGLGNVSGFPPIKNEDIQEALVAIKSLLTTIHGLKDGVQAKDLLNLVDLLEKIRRFFA